MLEAGALLGVLASGAAAGIASGLFGVGGGILMVPAALYLVPGTGFHEAKAVSLVVIVASSGIGVWTHHRHKSVDFRSGALLAAGGIGGAALAAVGVERIAEATLAAAFGIVLALVGARLALAKTKPTPTRAPPRSVWFLISLGLVAGVLAGAFGIGGGVVMVPGMVFAGVGMHLAVGTSLAAVFANAVGGTLAHVALGYGGTLVALGIPLAVGAIPGTYLGSKLAHRLHADRLRHAFGAALILVGLAMALDALF